MRARAACKVLTSSIAIVIGPTPPGTGRDRRSDLRRGLVVDIADQTVFEPVHADVDHHRPGFHGVGAKQARNPHRRDENVGTPADGVQVPGPGMTDGDGRVGRQQQARHRDPDQLRASDDHGLRPFELDALVAEQLHHPRRGAGHQAGGAVGEQAGVDRGEAVDVLAPGRSRRRPRSRRCGREGAAGRGFRRPRGPRRAGGPGPAAPPRPIEASGAWCSERIPTSSQASRFIRT